MKYWVLLYWYNNALKHEWAVEYSSKLSSCFQYY